MLVWNFNAHADPQVQLRPIEYFSSMAFRVPVGWFLSFLSAFGWAHLFFLFLSIYMKLPFLLAGSAIATILSGIWWPMLFVTMATLQLRIKDI
ncbi:MAG TPA: hypothetical protein EYH36_00340 [Desulfocapsa sulfexigens]|nr:hypothetical protein [Desulfocapsa sulfexigens]